MARGIIPDLHKETTVREPEKTDQKPNMWVLGPHATNGFAAAKTFLHSLELSEDSIRFVDRNPDIIQRVAENENDYGVIPISTTRNKFVDEVIEYLLGIQRQSDLGVSIVGEVEMDIRHFLLVNHSTTQLSDIRLIYSHPEAIEQCSGRLSELGIPFQAALSTAHAAKQIAESRHGKHAAIGSRLAAWHYGLQILEEDLQGRKKNRTRFYLLSRKPTQRTKNDQTVLLARIKDQPSSLWEWGNEFKKRNINTRGIRSIKEDGGGYAFFLELDGHQLDHAVHDLLAELRRHPLTERLLVLGSFPRSTDND
jgi:prephenate dehydratase